MTRLQFRVLLVAAALFAASFSTIVAGQPPSYRVVTVEGAATFEVPAEWRLLNERELSAAAARVASQASAAGFQVNLVVGQRLVYAPVSSKVGGNAVVALRGQNSLPFSRADLSGSAKQPLKAVVLQYFQAQSAAFERAVSAGGGRIVSRLEPHPVLLGGSIGVEYGSLYEQAQGTTVARQIVMFAGGNVLTLTFSYLKSAEAEFGPVYERLRISLKPV